MRLRRNFGRFYGGWRALPGYNFAPPGVVTAHAEYDIQKRSEHADG